MERSSTCFFPRLSQARTHPCGSHYSPMAPSQSSFGPLRGAAPSPFTLRSRSATPAPSLWRPSLTLHRTLLPSLLPLSVRGPTASPGASNMFCFPCPPALAATLSPLNSKMLISFPSDRSTKSYRQSKALRCGTSRTGSCSIEHAGSAGPSCLSQYKQTAHLGS